MAEIIGEILISSRLAEIQKRIGNVPELREEIEKCLVKKVKKVTQLMEVTMGGVFVLGASDLHLEPEEEGAKIRLRIDGVLQDVIIIDKKTYEDLLSRIKLLSGLKLNVTDRPQDGRFSAILDKLSIEIRTSSLPAEHGETIVLRILNPKDLIEIEALGLREDLLEIFRKEIKKPNGMIIITGPTGCGKTTTLYAFLKEIWRPEIKIITIEDPIEYHLPGISQTQVQPKKEYDFASGLRSIVRQDPDVILVGEIRDLETADIALQAALTGHLVLTTLHTNDAAGTVARLTSLGAEPFNIGPALNLAVAQRLVRKVCKDCGRLVKIPAKDFRKIKKGLWSLPKTIETPRLSLDLKIPRAKGCKNCNFTGYRGRMGIFEGFLVDDEMEKFILKKPSVADLRSLAVKKGMILMKQDGLLKVLKGITTIEEVERVTGE